MITSNPLLYLAPMEDVTDTSFRKICKNFGADVVVSEFVASEALIRTVEKSYRKISFDESERPFGVQIFGHRPEAMRDAAKIVESWKPDFIDLNFGCPVKKIVAKGAGAALLKNIPLMLEITCSVVDAVKIPVTAKTRLGWEENDKPIVSLAEQLQDCGIAALCVHARTRAQLYTGQADWTLLGEIKANPRFKIPLIGNGDINSGEKAKAMLELYGVDALMIGRAAIGNPFIFRNIKEVLNGNPVSEITMKERLEVIRTHVVDTVKIKGEKRGVLEMRRHYAPYFRGVLRVKHQKMNLMEAQTLSEILKILEEIEKK